MGHEHMLQEYSGKKGDEKKKGEKGVVFTFRWSGCWKLNIVIFFLSVAVYISIYWYTIGNMNRKKFYLCLKVLIINLNEKLISDLGIFQFSVENT